MHNFLGGWRGKESVIMSNVKVETKLDNERYILNHLFAVGKFLTIRVCCSLIHPVI